MRKNRQISVVSKKKYAFVVDGKCEFWYVQMLKRNEKSINIDLKPELAQSQKLSEQYNRVIHLAKDYDKVFWIIDFDVINKETQFAKKGSKTALQSFKEYYEKITKNQKNVVIIINNPCLEFWFLLHFEQTSKYFTTCDEASTQLEKHLSDYAKTQSYFTKQDNDIYLKLKPHLEEAVANAKKLEKFDINKPFSAMSQMQIFFEIANI